MTPSYVGSTMSTLLTRMPVNAPSPELSHSAGNTCWPQKWPPDRTIEMLSNVVVPLNPTNGIPKLIDEIVSPGYVSWSAA